MRGDYFYKKIFFGWWIVFATSLIHFWGAGTFFYSFTAFFNPIVDEFGWSYAAVSFAASIRSIEGGIATPIVGFAADRYGARNLLIIGSVLGGLGFICLSQIHTIGAFYLIFILHSIGASLLFPVPGWTAMTNWFVLKRGKVFGILSAAIGVGGVLIYFSNWLIGIYGWRLSFMIIGVATWIIGIPASLIVRQRPEPYGLLPDGEPATAKSAKEPSANTHETATEHVEGFSVRQALKTRAFWLIALTVTFSSGAVHAVTVHVMPYLINANFTRNDASLIAALLVLVSTIGRFGAGWISNRVDNRRLLLIALLLQIVGLLMLSVVQNFWQAMLFVFLFGPGYGSVITIRLILQVDFFGRKAFGAIQGIVMAIAIIGTMSFPLLAGVYYDMFSGYRAVWLALAAMLFICLPFAMMVNPPQQVIAKLKNK
jgi:sugar phosphate permease